MPERSVAGLAAAAGQRQIFFNLHGGGGAGHRILEYAADVLGPLVLRQAGDINAVNDDLAAVHRPDTGHCVQRGGFAGAVAADHGDEVALIQMEGDAPERTFFVDRARVKGFVNVLNVKHWSALPSWPC